MSDVKNKSKYICVQSNKLSKADILDIGHLLVRSGNESLIKESSDGCRINLDKLDSEIIEQIYNMVKHKTRN